MQLIYFKKLYKDQSGSALLGLIVTMVFLSALAAAMIAQTTTGSLGFVNENSSLRAYYLAESGFRYAAAKLKNGGELALDTLHKHESYSIGNHGHFTIEFKTYIFKFDNVDVANELVTKVPFGDASSLADASTKSPLESGQYFYVKAGNTVEAVNSIVVQDSGGTPDPNGEYVKFTKDSGSWSEPIDERVKLVVKSNGDDVAAEGGNLKLQEISQVEVFPLHNGRFEAQGKTYSYKQRGTNKLVGIYCVSGGCSWPLTLTDGDDIILQDFTILHSIGTYVETSREIVYNIPVSTSEKAEFHDTFDSKDDWEQVSTLGTHDIETIGDSVLKVTGTDSVGGADVGSLIKIDSSKVDAMLERSHASAGNFLSYDAQVKVGFYPSVPSTYMAGISFRQDAKDPGGTTTGNSYGISFLKGGSSDGIPDAFVPLENIPLIILWQQTSGGSSKKWLAYKSLASPVFFFDDMERGEAKWTKEDDWTRFKTDSYSGTRCWHDSPNGDYLNNSNISLTTSKTIDLSGALSAVLSFWHHYDIEQKGLFFWWDWGSVDISTNDGTNWTRLIRYEGSQGLWTSKVLDISSYLPSDSVKIRFLLHTDGSVVRDGWYIDDVKISGVVDFPVNEATLMVRVKEAATVSFTSGGTIPIEVGDIVTQTNGASGTVIETPILESGGWDGTAAGIILLNKLPRNIDGTITTPFASGDLNVNGVKRATANSFRARDNYIKVYYGDKNGYGTPDGQWLDYDKHGNPRGELHWPPDELEDWSADNDFFTLVQWDEVNSTVSSLDKISSLDEPDAILRTNELTTPTTGTFTDTEIGLHTFGNNSTSIYFDDFGLQTDVPTSEGFLPAVQQ